jgi:large subunit ribosomal protein L18
MKTHTSEKRKKRIARHIRLRAKLSGTAKVPRLAVFRSQKYLWVQGIDDHKGKTIFAASDRELKAEKETAKKERVEALAEIVAKKAKEAGVTRFVFDRGGFAYHGRIKAFAEALREKGLKF